MSDTYGQRMCGTRWTWAELQISEKRREVRLERWNAASPAKRDELEKADAFAGWEHAPGEWVWPNKRATGCTCGGCYYRFSAKWWAFCDDERSAQAADKRRELEAERARLNDRTGLVRAGDLRVGWRINGRTIENLTTSTAFGVVLVHWGFGHAETTDWLSGVEPGESNALA